VGPEHAFLQHQQRGRYVSVDDDEALGATYRLSRLEGILPALETAHAVAYLDRLMPETEEDQVIVVNISGRGDKDLNTIIKANDGER
jgi:tryptophan synthase beta chain